jgi:hypothetical protein
MMKKQNGKLFGYGSTATYRIQVGGTIEESLADRLGEMRVIVRQFRGQQPVTTFRGRVRDQAELMGLLNNLHGFQLSILAVENLSVK